MGVSDTLTKEMKGIAILVIIIVVFSIVLIKFKDVDGGACVGGYSWNSTASLCYNSTGANTTQNTIGAAIDTAVTSIKEPISWITIIVIIIVVAWLMKYLKSKKSNM